MYVVCVNALLSPDAYSKYVSGGYLGLNNESVIVSFVVNRSVGRIELSVKAKMQLGTLLVSVVCEMDALTPSIPTPVELCISTLEIFT